MPAIRLDQRRVDALKPRRTAYDVRDRDLKGFGVRIRPGGGKTYFIQSQHEGRRTWKILGRAEDMDAEGARARALAIFAAMRSDGEPSRLAAANLPFEAVAEEVFRRYARNWKPATLKVNRCYYRNRILPWFRGQPIGSIAESDVRQWFASLHNAPFAADRSAPVLSVILSQAEAYGYRPTGTNPCRGIRRYRRQGRERFLSAAEFRRLGEALARHESRRPSEVAILRLLLLTGCRRGEILTLKWSFYREGNLFLPDSKTGPRTVWLSSPARKILDGLPRNSAWVFPSPRCRGPIGKGMLNGTWNRIRAQAGISDVRLHDLRHSYASVALAAGETILAIGRLLGHRDPATTLKYTHLSDSMLRDAAETVGAVLEG